MMNSLRGLGPAEGLKEALGFVGVYQVQIPLVLKAGIPVPPLDATAPEKA